MTAVAPPTVLDVVYPVRGGDNNPELRWSLRSLEQNFPHATVWLVGYQPSWVTGVEFIRGNHRALRANIYFNLLEACRTKGVGDRFVVMNDDFFVTAPVTEIPVLYRSTLVEHLALPKVVARSQHWWSRSLHTTLSVLQAEGFEVPLSYELHTPFVADKALMRDTLERFALVDQANPPQWRTLYGNINQIGGRQGFDGKCYRPGPIQVPFHSTDDSSFRHFHVQLAEAFPEPSRYETR